MMDSLEIIAASDLKDTDSKATKWGSVFIGLMTPDGAI